MKNPTFLIIGESCIDVFEYGNCDRLCPEAPVPVFVRKEETRTIGMAANVAANLESIFNKMNKGYELLLNISYPYSTKTRYVDSKTNHIFLRIDDGDEKYSPISLNKELFNNIRCADFILISDYNKGYLNEKSIIKILSEKKKNCIVIMDTKKIVSNKICQLVNYFKLNNAEYKNVMKNSPELVNKYKNKFIITKGSEGTEYKGRIYPVNVQQTIDVSGAGDTFLAALGYSLGDKKSIVDSIIFANEIASSVVTKRGVTTI